MDLCKESIAKAFGGDERKYEKVFKIIDKRWSDQLHRPLHAAGHILNPGLYYKNAAAETLDGEVWDDYISCLEKLVPDHNLRDKMSVELGKYRQADGTFGKESAIRARDRLSPVEWWMQYGNHVPALQKFAIKVLSLTCSASGC
ncbi:uncharacterized protein LOC132043564 [Lycium ferocissimum]|uniref:uncharacterized protein LOC132043564 n=1 Tax=Lycium ferocissimum TaxID=112874 RepID=UPI00281689E8|nr:uncharacterized protein LOC132043564 [Lycium ferocissimum]